VKSGLVWSKTSLTLLSTKAEIISVPVILTLSTFFTVQLKNGQLDQLSAQVTETWEMCFMSYSG